MLEALPLATTDDRSLVQAAVQGHPGAARAIWRRFASLVRGLLQRTLGADEVEDHVQETFLRFFRHADELRDPSLLKSFMVGITMRVARSELRRRRLRRWLHLTDTGQLPELDAPPADHAGREAISRLYAILDRVDDAARLIFILRHVEELELAAISEALGCSLATTKRRLARASKRILAQAQQEPALRRYLEASNDRG